jgi:hypothetical protein
MEMMFVEAASAFQKKLLIGIASLLTREKRFGKD